MPLHPYREFLVGTFQALDDAVFCGLCGDAQAVPKPVHRLMMPRIDRVLPLAQDCRQFRVRRHTNLMRGL